MSIKDPLKSRNYFDVCMHVLLRLIKDYIDQLQELRKRLSQLQSLEDTEVSLPEVEDEIDGDMRQEGDEVEDMEEEDVSGDKDKDGEGAEFTTEFVSFMLLLSLLLLLFLFLLSVWIEDIFVDFDEENKKELWLLLSLLELKWFNLLLLRFLDLILVVEK